MNIEARNTELIRSLIESFAGAQVEIGQSPIDGRKFKVDLDGKRSFLCVSTEYLGDQSEARIKKDFEGLQVERMLRANAGQYFLLANSGLTHLLESVARS